MSQRFGNSVGTDRGVVRPRCAPMYGCAPSALRFLTARPYDTIQSIDAVFNIQCSYSISILVFRIYTIFPEKKYTSQKHACRRKVRKPPCASVSPSREHGESQSDSIVTHSLHPRYTSVQLNTADRPRLTCHSMQFRRTVHLRSRGWDEAAIREFILASSRTRGS